MRPIKAMFGAGQAAFVPAGPFADLNFSPTTASSALSFKNDGVLDWISSAGGTVSQGRWQTGGGTPSQYTIRVDPTSGTLSSGSTGVDLNLGTTRTFTVNQAVVGTKSCTVTITIKNLAGVTLYQRTGVVISAQMSP